MSKYFGKQFIQFPTSKLCYVPIYSIQCGADFVLHHVIAIWKSTKRLYCENVCLTETSETM